MIYLQQSSRDLLEKELARKQLDNPRFSANAFAKKAGISQAYLSLMLRGHKQITEKVGVAIADGLKLDLKQREYFLLLIKRERAKDAETKTLFEKKLLQVRETYISSANDLKFFEIISEWHYSALLEAISLDMPSHSSESFAEKLGLSAELVKEALETLHKLNLIQRKGNRWTRRDSGYLKTSTEVRNEALRRFHKEILKLGQDAIEDQDMEKRSFTGVTVATDPALIPEAKKRILEFQRELMRFLESGSRKEIYQLEVQLFRLQGKEGKKI